MQAHGPFCHARLGAALRGEGRVEDFVDLPQDQWTNKKATQRENGRSPELRKYGDECMYAQRNKKTHKQTNKQTSKPTNKQTREAPDGW
jgi:hypothetical protein